uniref:Uncharacterized protein n=1 Tax=Leptobrachium leishanense TaxID=445787 RepID=A0A8C5MTS8_9ANUR
MDQNSLQLEEIIKKLKEDGLYPGSPGEDHLTFLWKLYQGSQTKLQEVTSSLTEVRQQQAEEMKEVENYVAHIRSLTEEREALTTDFEKENIQLRIELEKLQVQQDSQLKEVEEMLDQEGLNEIAQSSPSEQIAYLLVERATLLEKLELLEHKLDAHLQSLSEVKRQDELEQIHQTLEEELHQQRESMKRTKESLNKSYDEELDKEKRIRECVERDLDEAARRLQMSHEEIRRLTDDLLIKDKVISELEQSLQKTQQETEKLKDTLLAAQENDSQELQKAKEYSSRLDKEILALRNRVKSLDSERKKLAEQSEKSASESLACSSPKQNTSSLHDNETLHKSCQLTIEERESLNKQLLHKLQKLQREHDETVERNEELESILGETQNQTKEKMEFFEGQTAGLQKMIKNLEAELLNLREGKDDMLGTGRTNRADPTEMPDLQQILSSNEEKIKLLERQLNKEKQEQQRLSSQLVSTQKAMQAVKEEMQTSTVKMKELQGDLRCLKRAEQERNFLRVANDELERVNRAQDMKVILKTLLTIYFDITTATFPHSIQVSDITPFFFFLVIPVG